VRLFDSHAHIGAPELLAQAPELLGRAREAGLVGVIAIGAGYGLEANAGAIALAHDHADVWATVGLHPHDAASWNGAAGRRIAQWLIDDRVRAVGECGLDYWYEHSPREAQQDCLRAQIALAREHELPLVIHVRPSRDTREAFEDLLRIFDDTGAESIGGVIHCFTGDLPFAEDCLARGFDISFSGIVTFKAANDLRAVAARLPLDRLLIETDSPLLAPVPFRGKPNEPAWVERIAQCLAELHGVTPNEIASRTTARACRVFAIDEPA
jgi:TatD DNase family protein